MENYQIRVVEEQNELNSKIDKLRAFLESEPDVDTTLLLIQCHVMISYSQVLQARIAEWK